MKHIYLVFLLVTSIGFAQLTPPASLQTYYTDVDFNTTGMTLFNDLAIETIAKHSNFLSYSEIWDSSKITDEDPDNNSNVLLIYGYNDTDGNSKTDRSRSKNLNGGTNGTDWNREHTFPNSLASPKLEDDIFAYADAHNLRPADVDMNGSRGNLKFAAGSGNSGSVSGGWYPGDEWRGDAARIIMYMYLRLGNRCYPSFATDGSTNAFDINMIDLLLDWNSIDPVSEIEDKRNTYHANTSNTYAQGNRNPFIDNPYLATVIWGGTPAQDRWNTTPDTEVPTTPTALAAVNPTETTVDLSWTASTDNIAVSSYDVYLGGAFYVNTSSNTTTYTVTGLTASTAYTFTLLAKDASGNESSLSTSATETTTAPDTEDPTIPASLTASNPTASTIDLSWTASTDNTAVTSYDVYVGGIFYVNTGSNTTTYTVLNLASETAYTFTILAKDAAGNASSQSNSAIETTLVGSSDCASEDFANIPAGQSNYTTRTWTGTDGFWTATDARTDQSLNSKAICIRNGTLTSPALSGGIGSLTVTTQLTFGGSAGTFDVLVNNVSVGSIPYGSDNTTSTTTTLSNINTSGSVTVVLDNQSTTNRVRIDDLSFTCYTGTLDIDNNDFVAIKLYPNPLNGDQLFIKANEILNVKIFSILGEKITDSSVDASKSYIKVSNLNKGVYLVSISNGNKSVTKKLIKL